MSGERVGIGRVYAKVDGPLTFEKWIQSISKGRSYVSDGYCHLLDYQASSEKSNLHTEVGVNGSEIALNESENITFSADFAAKLEAGKSEVELVVNGYPVAKQEVKSDGSKTTVKFKHRISESCWVAMRVFPNAHTNPIYITVKNQPILGPTDSIRWCLAGVEQCWKSKQSVYAVDEQADAEAAYDHARKVYSDLLREAEARD